MSILVDEYTHVVVQGITGREGRFHAEQMVTYGTDVVAGVTPGKGGHEVCGVQVFNTVCEAVEKTDANTSIIFVPSAFAADAALEAMAAGLRLVVVITEGIPVLDMVKVVRMAEITDTVLIGPNCPGVISPGKSKVGILPGDIFMPGNVGIISRSGTLTYEVVNELTERGLGQSTCIGVGGDPIIGTTFTDLLRRFEADGQTDAVVLIGEIGGVDEEIACEFIKEMTKPVVGFISGLTAPEGKRMGHAGAIISGSYGTAESKLNAMKDAGVSVAKTPAHIAELTAEIIHQISV
ncbi:MAG: succinate--CoA ligase subunit alpha [bacterium]